MTGATLFSGILAPEVAMPWVDWKFCAEVDPFACAVIKHHRPKLPNLGDVNAEDFAERARAYGPIDLLVAGAPCQDFSVAGQRAGMGGARGYLDIEFRGKPAADGNKYRALGNSMAVPVLSWLKERIRAVHEISLRKP